ncbi:uncharacterized protein FFNC_15693 [Fusarium fujikuroi]|nr:uncharacterized protein FFNC_15693 [Fusarium fujikuroi]
MAIGLEAGMPQAYNQA